MKQTKFILFSFLLLLFTACSQGLSIEENEEIVPTTAAELEVYEYNIPVIFHVLYNNSSSANVTIEQSRVSEILDYVNIHYNGSIGDTDMGVQFYLAAESSDGVPLTEAGINRVYVSGTYPLSYEEVMEGTEYKDILWDPNEYINILLYSFDDANTLGVSWMPYMNSNSDGYIEGVNGVNYTSLSLSNLGFTYCVSINSTYINNQSTTQYYDPADITVTLAHELGHYLGLHHVYAETEDGSYADSFEDTDYCDDTISYNRIEYEEYITKLYNMPVTPSYNDLIKREDENGDEFTSDNYMDYYFSSSDNFTADQKTRTRAVLNYGLLIPGPKVVTKSVSANVVDGEIIDLPSKLIE